MPKVYEVDGILEGYSNRDKLTSLYNNLLEEVLISEPLHRHGPTARIGRTDRSRKGSYYWELHEVEESLITLEMHGDWTGHANQRATLPATSDWLHYLKITIHHSKPNLESQIKEIISRYSRDKATS